MIWCFWSELRRHLYYDFGVVLRQFGGGGDGIRRRLGEIGQRNMDSGVHGEAVNVVGGCGDGIRGRLGVVVDINMDSDVHGEALYVVNGIQNWLDWDRNL